MSFTPKKIYGSGTPGQAPSSGSELVKNFNDNFDSVKSDLEEKDKKIVQLEQKANGELYGTLGYIYVTNGEFVKANTASCTDFLECHNKSVFIDVLLGDGTSALSFYNAEKTFLYSVDSPSNKHIVGKFKTNGTEFFCRSSCKNEHTGRIVVSDIFSDDVNLEIKDIRSDSTNKDLKINQLEQHINNLYEKTVAIKTTGIYNGTNSNTDISNNIVLENDGDSLEFIVKLIPSDTPQDFRNLAVIGEKDKTRNTIGFYLQDNVFVCRANDGSWIFSLDDADLKIPTSTDAHIKLEYASGKMNAYINDVLKKSVPTQKAILINNIGQAYLGFRFKGEISNVVIYKNNNPVRLDTIDTDVIVTKEPLGKGFLSNYQNELLKLIGKSKSSEFYLKLNNILDLNLDQKTLFGNVYCRIKDNSYIEFDLLYEVKETGAIPSGEFRFGKILRISGARIVVFENNSFNQTGITALVPSENEFVLNFDGKFSCGYHGGERLTTCHFFIDGVMYDYKSNSLDKGLLIAAASIEISALSEVFKDSDSMEYQAKRKKHIRFKNGFDIENTVWFDQAIQSTTYYYSGIMCNHHNIATNITSDSSQTADCSYVDSERSITLLNKPITEVLTFYNSDNAFQIRNIAILDPNWITDDSKFFIRVRAADAKFYKGSINKIPTLGTILRCGQSFSISQK